ncbi:MAG: hypothetical protein JWO42_531 [Chloroflexi bacterium]|nr:hypothetical protein [Chloroflexota bacterium]
MAALEQHRHPYHLNIVLRHRPAAHGLPPGIQPHAAHDLVYHRGKIVASLSFKNFYVGGAAAWNQAERDNIDGKLAAAMADAQLNNVMAQYYPTGTAIVSAFLGSAILDGAPPNQIGKADVEAMASTLFTSGQLAGVDLANSVCNFVLPHGTILTDNGGAQTGGTAETGARRSPGHPEAAASSLTGLGGYHGSVHVQAANGSAAIVYYAVGVFSEQLPNGTTNGIVAFDQGWKNVVATFYHELNEARTDADVEDAIRAGSSPTADSFLGWVSAQGEECGDFPVFEANPLTEVFQEVPLADGTGTVPVQFMYSNAVHGPQGPVPAPLPSLL